MSKDDPDATSKAKTAIRPKKGKAAGFKFEDLDLDLPAGFKDRKTFTEAEALWLVARSSAFMPPARYICVTDLTTGLCVRFNRDQTGDYSIPDGRPPRDCSLCSSGR